MQKIEFTYIHAAILHAGLIDDAAAECPNYRREKQLVGDLLQIGPARPVDTEMKKWWRDSRYNVQIELVRKRMMRELTDALAQMNVSISGTSLQSVTVDNFTFANFAVLRSKLAADTVQLLFSPPVKKIIVYAATGE